MQKARDQPKGRLVKLERSGHVGDVKDGVAELHVGSEAAISLQIAITTDIRFGSKKELLALFE